MQSIHSCCVHIRAWIAGLTDAFVSMDVRSSTFELSATFLTYKLLLRNHSIPLSLGGEFRWCKNISLEKSHNRGFYMNQVTSVITFAHQLILLVASDWPALATFMSRSSTLSGTCFRKVKCLINTKITDWGISCNERALYSGLSRDSNGLYECTQWLLNLIKNGICLCMKSIPKLQIFPN